MRLFLYCQRSPGGPLVLRAVLRRRGQDGAGSAQQLVDLIARGPTGAERDDGFLPMGYRQHLGTTRATQRGEVVTLDRPMLPDEVVGGVDYPAMALRRTLRSSPGVSRVELRIDGVPVCELDPECSA